MMKKRAEKAKKSILGIGAHGGDARRMKDVMANFQAAQVSKLAGATKVDLVAFAHGVAKKRDDDAKAEVRTRLALPR